MNNNMVTFINSSYYLFIKDILTFTLTICGLIIASHGLTTWKKQIKGGREFEIAYNLHYAVLKLRDAIKYVRNPGIWPSENHKAIQYFKAKYPEKSVEDIENNSNAYVYEMRWEKIISASTEMESHLLSAEVIWGSDILNLIKPLNKKITKLKISLSQYFQPQLRTGDIMEIDDIIYDKSYEDKEDDFSNEITECIKKITNYIKEKIS